VRGLGRAAKRCMASDTMVGTKADVTCLCETKLKAPSPQFLNTIGPRRIDKWECKGVMGASGGILIGFDSSLFSLEEVWEGEFSLSLVLKGRTDNFSQVITLVTDLTKEN